MRKTSRETQDHYIRRKCSKRDYERSDTASKAILQAKRYCVRISVFISWFLMLISHISCCGYSTRSLLPGYIQKVHIKIFNNKTIKIGLDELATNAVIEAFLSGSSLRIVDEKSADIVIEGDVSDYSKEPLTYTAGQTVLEYKITVKFSVRCIDQTRNDVFWEGDISDWATFTTNEEEAITRAIKNTAERLVTTILTNW